MQIPFSPPDMTEAEEIEVAQVLRSGWITTGPRTKEFERQIASYCHTPKVVCLNSATACMEMILRVLGVGPGDEVITSAYTYTASASVACHVGAKLVMVDTAPNSFEMDMSNWRRLSRPGQKSSFRWIWQELFVITIVFSLLQTIKNNCSSHPTSCKTLLVE